MASLAASGCGPSGLRIQVEGASPYGNCQVPSPVRPSSALRWKPGSDAKAGLRRRAQGDGIERVDNPLHVTGRHRGVPAATPPAGLLPVGEHHDRTRAVVPEGLQDSVGVDRAGPGQRRHPLEGRSLRRDVLEEVQAAQVPRADRGAERQASGQSGAAEAPPFDPGLTPDQNPAGRFGPGWTSGYHAEVARSLSGPSFRKEKRR